MRTPRLGAWLALSATVIVLDQWVKAWIAQHFAYGDTLSVTGFFNLVHARNTGAAFSFLAGEAGWQRFVFIAIALAAVVLIVYLLKKYARDTGFCLALSLVLGGAVGNLIDRIRLGYVIDFLDFYYATWHFPAFNVADSAITVGAAILIWDSLRKKDGART